MVAEDLCDRVTFERPEVSEGAGHVEILEDIIRRYFCGSACAFLSMCFCVSLCFSTYYVKYNNLTKRFAVCFLIVASRKGPKVP